MPISFAAMTCCEKRLSVTVGMVALGWLVRVSDERISQRHPCNYVLKAIPLVRSTGPILLTNSSASPFTIHNQGLTPQFHRAQQFHMTRKSWCNIKIDSDERTYWICDGNWLIMDHQLWCDCDGFQVLISLNSMTEWSRTISMWTDLWNSPSRNWQTSRAKNLCPRRECKAAYYRLIKWNARVGLDVGFISSDPDVRADLDISSILLDTRQWPTFLCRRVTHLKILIESATKV